ncbi:MAG: aminoacyl-tRNA hydrolase [Candidatus Methylacidiphilales bacterium]|nr:aminoacyl-tRNA hydrolase [Candidatus Methylacidiphilales bacterium]
MAGLFPLVVGLGNPGAAYRNTRHNVGFAALDRWADKHGAAWKTCRFADALVAQVPEGIWLAKPQSYMNCSGPEVVRMLRWFKLLPGQMIVVVDDVHLPVGRLRLRVSGSEGGHNGLRSVASATGTQAYPRLRCGVGSADPSKDLKDHVLGHFRRDEQETVEKMIARAVDGLGRAQSVGLEAVMNELNGTV